MFQSGVGFTAVYVSVDEEVMGDYVSSYAGLGDKAVEREQVGVFRVAEEGGHDGVAGEDGGAAVGVDRVAGE